MNWIEKLAREHGTGGWQSLDDMVLFGKKVAAEERSRLEAENKELRDLLTYWMPFIESEEGDERQAPWVEKVREALAKPKEPKDA